MSKGFIDIKLGSRGDVYVKSVHKCYKGKWYYKAKKRLAALKSNVKSTSVPSNLAAFEAGVKAAALTVTNHKECCSISAIEKFVSKSTEVIAAREQVKNGKF